MAYDDISNLEVLDVIAREIRNECKGAKSLYSDIHMLVQSGLGIKEAVIEASLQGLFKFISGELMPFTGGGITTYPNRVDGQKRTHESCLELERRGKITRHFEDKDCVVWKAIL